MDLNQRPNFVDGMAVNMMPAPAVWSGEEPPSLLDQEGPVSGQAPIFVPCQSATGEELHSSRPADTGPPRSKSKGELVIVINEKLKNGKYLSVTSY